MAALTATVVLAEAEIDRIFNAEHMGVFIASALRLEVEADPFARDGFHVEVAQIVATSGDENGELIGPDHFLHHGLGRFCRQPFVIRDVHAALEYERVGRRDAA